MKLFLCLLISLGGASCFADAGNVDKVAEALSKRANEDCKFLQEKNQKHRDANPEFFKGDLIFKSCYINMRVMLDKCVVDTAKAIAARSKPSDSLEIKKKIVTQESGVQKACVQRALEITQDEVNEAAANKAKADVYVNRALGELNKRKSESKEK